MISHASVARVAQLVCPFGIDNQAFERSAEKGQMCVFWTAGIGPRLAVPLPCATAAGDEPRR